MKLEELQIGMQLFTLNIPDIVVGEDTSSYENRLMSVFSGDLTEMLTENYDNRFYPDQIYYPIFISAKPHTVEIQSIDKVDILHLYKADDNKIELCDYPNFQKVEVLSKIVNDVAKMRKDYMDGISSSTPINN